MNSEEKKFWRLFGQKNFRRCCFTDFFLQKFQKYFLLQFSIPGNRPSSGGQNSFSVLKSFCLFFFSWWNFFFRTTQRRIFFLGRTKSIQKLLFSVKNYFWFRTKSDETLSYFFLDHWKFNWKKKTSWPFEKQNEEWNGTLKKGRN